MIFTPIQEIDPRKISSIIIRCPNWIGDAVMATPLLQALRNLFPTTRFIGTSHQIISDLYQESPFFDDFIPISRKKGERRDSSQKLISYLQRTQPDLGILLTNSLSSAWVFYRGKIAKRLGFTSPLRWPFLTHPVSKNATTTRELHDVERYLQLLQPIQESYRVIDRRPELALFVGEKEKKLLQERLEREYNTIYNRHTIILINPGAAYGSAKCWPIPSFRVVIERLLEDMKNRIFILGDESMAQLGDQIIQNLPLRVYNLAGKTTLRELMALISIGDVLLSNDSGPMHIASALHKPLVALFGSTNPFRTGPFNGGNLLYKAVECSPCYRRTCPIDFRCMTAISPEEVHTSLIDLLKKEK